MSATVDLRNRVLSYINSADDRLLRMMQALAESYKEDEEESLLTTAQEEELDRRLERHRRGETKFHTWEEAKAKIKNSNEI